MTVRPVVSFAIVALVGACAAGKGPAAPTPKPAPPQATMQPIPDRPAPRTTMQPIPDRPAGATAAEQAAFTAWLARYRGDVTAQGIKPEIYDAATAGIQLNQSVLDANERQPEFTKQIWEYLDSAVSEKRIENGRAMLRTHAAALARAEKKYSVEPQIVAAIWGLESSYGAFKGDIYIIEALATLAYQGPRTAFAREQLPHALRLMQTGDVTREEMRGSWAGAMGHTQFIPTAYQRFAVDGDGDGRRDLFESLDDVFASTAHYLASNGWKKGQPWGFEVKLPAGFAFADADPTNVMTVEHWARAGVARTDGKPLLGPGVSPTAAAAIMVPGGHQGPAFLLLDNFRVILTYNNSTAYGLGIGHLSDRLVGKPAIQAPWPRTERALSRIERMELQQLLTAKGFPVGEHDGIIGKETRAAIKAFQASRKLVADGFASASLLARLKE